MSEKPRFSPLRVLLKWLRPPRTLKINTSGWFFIGLVIAVELAAVNTGNNLLYIIMGGMLSFIIASGILSNIDLRNLTVKRHLPEHLFARTPALVQIEIENNKRHIPSFLLVVEAASTGKSAALIGSVRAHGNAQAFLETIFPRRGLYEMGPIKVSTNFPFGLFTKGMEVRQTQQVLVFPRITEVDATPYDTRGREGETAILRVGHGTDPFSVKDFQPGDNPRHIHWKSTAKRGKFMRREFSREQERRITIKIHPDEGGNSDLLEEKIERAASLASRLITEGYAVGLVCGNTSVFPDRGWDHLLFILEELAVFDAARERTAIPPTDDEPGIVVEI